MSFSDPLGEFSIAIRFQLHGNSSSKHVSLLDSRCLGAIQITTIGSDDLKTPSVR